MKRTLNIEKNVNISKNKKKSLFYALSEYKKSIVVVILVLITNNSIISDAQNGR